MMNATDTPRGAEIARRYYLDVVRPLLDARWPDLPHAAGRLGTGSDVFGLDDETSRDHDWGLRLSLFVADELVESIDAYLDAHLPPHFAGLPTRFPFTGSTEPRHHVETWSVQGFLRDRLGFCDLERLTAHEWLSLTGQSVMEVSAGPVFHDAGGVLQAARRALEWYPRDLWSYVVASCWSQLEEEMPLMGRAGQVGDDRGSRIIGHRLAQTTMQLTFLTHRAWAPYPKWFGALFDRLPHSGPVGEALDTALATRDWRSRQEAVAAALEHVLDLQRLAGLPAPAPAILPFWDRPFRAPNESIAAELYDSIVDPAIQALPRGRGSIEQLTDSVAVLVSPRARLAAVRGATVPATPDP